jgi:translation initiation factor eIF-2B subunit delta
MTLPSDIQERIDHIAADNLRGAAELAREAVEILFALSLQSHARSANDLRALFVRVAQAIVKTQPTMAPLIYLADRIVRGTEHLESVEELQRELSVIGESFALTLDQHRIAVARHAVKLVAPNSVVMTHSSSSTVFEALHEAWNLGKRFEVLCTESRPMLEGVEFARALARANIPVSLVIDAAASSFMERASLMFVGGDALGSQGLINKTGTLGLALAAKNFSVPMYALCDSTKFLPKEASVHLEQGGDPYEVLRQPPVGMTVHNRYYDLTPLRFLRGVVTERGVLETREVLQAIKLLKLSASLRRL